MKQKINDWEYIKIKSFCTAKETINNNKKGNVVNGRRYLQMIYPMRGSYPKYIKDFYNSTSKKTIGLKKMGRGPEYTVFQRHPDSQQT